MKTKKLCICYGYNFNEEIASKIANNFDAVIMDMEHDRTDFYLPYASWVEYMKNINPTLKVFAYHAFTNLQEYTYEYLECNQHENWFVHDAYGNRIKDRQFNGYLMDISNAEYIKHWIQYTKEHTTSLYDGVMIDAVWGAVNDGMAVSFTSTPTDDFINNWAFNTVTALTSIKQGIGKNCIINSDRGWRWNMTQTDFLDCVDGQLVEGFYHASWENSSIPRYIPTMTSFVETCRNKNKIVFVVSGSADFNQEILNYCYAKYLMVSYDNSYFNFGVNYYDIDQQIYPILNNIVGMPKENFIVSGANNEIQTRTFDYLTVSVNDQTLTSTYEFIEYVPNEPTQHDVSKIIIASLGIALLMISALLLGYKGKN